MCLERLQRQAASLRQWLTDHPEDRAGSRKSVRQSNRTDNESAKMATSKDVIQGYCGVAAVDADHQIIMAAQAHGTGSEQSLLLSMIEATAPERTAQTLYTADAGYHSKANIEALGEANIPALIADNGMRARDARFKTQARHKQKPDPLYNKAAIDTPAKTRKRCYRPNDVGALLCMQRNRPV